jgi:hypothetical protein
LGEDFEIKIENLELGKEFLINLMNIEFKKRKKFDKRKKFKKWCLKMEEI